MAGLSQPKPDDDLEKLVAELDEMEAPEREQKIEVETTDYDLERIGSERSPMELIRYFSKRLLAVIDDVPFTDHEKGRIYHAAGKYGEAESFYKKAFKQDSNLYRNLGELYVEMEMPAKAAQHYEEAIEKGVREAHYYLGRVCLARREYNYAINCFMHTTGQDIDEGYLGLGDTYAELYYLNRYDESIFNDAVGNLKEAERLKVKGAAFALGKLYYERVTDLKASKNTTEFVTLAQKHLIRAVTEGSSEANILLNLLPSCTEQNPSIEADDQSEEGELDRTEWNRMSQKNSEALNGTEETAYIESIRDVMMNVAERIAAGKIDRHTELTAEECFAAGKEYERISETMTEKDSENVHRWAAISFYKKAAAMGHEPSRIALINLHIKNGNTGKPARKLFTVASGSKGKSI